MDSRGPRPLLASLRLLLPLPHLTLIKTLSFHWGTLGKSRIIPPSQNPGSHLQSLLAMQGDIHTGSGEEDVDPFGAGRGIIPSIALEYNPPITQHIKINKKWEKFSRENGVNQDTSQDEPGTRTKIQALTAAVKMLSQSCMCSRLLKRYKISAQNQEQ